MRLNDGHVTYLGLLAKKDGTRRGCLSKKSSDNTKWHTKWFALLQNMLFYFENESSSRPSGLYLLEGCVCDRAPSPKPSLSAKECLEKQVRSIRNYFLQVTFYFKSSAVKINWEGYLFGVGVGAADDAT